MRQVALAEVKIIQLRARAGIDAGADGRYGLKTNITVAKMTQVIRNERRVELVFEDHRWYNFHPGMYLLPMPDPEIQKMPAMLQNPGR
jgi:hypothetical protein